MSRVDSFLRRNLLIAAATLGISVPAMAGYYTELSGNWETAANWTTGIVPGDLGDTGEAWIGRGSPVGDVSVTVTTDRSGTEYQFSHLRMGFVGAGSVNGDVSVTINAGAGIKPNSVSMGWDGGHAINLDVYGTLAASGGLAAGRTYGQTATATIHTGGVFTAAASSVGSGGAVGVLNISGGDFTLGSNSSLTVGAGQATVGENIYGGHGTVYHTSGTVTLGRYLGVGGSGDTNMDVQNGISPYAKGYYNLSGGTLNGGSRLSGIGMGGAYGEFNLSGTGLLNMSNDMQIGGSGTNGTGEGHMNVSGGTWNVRRVYVGASSSVPAGTGTLHIVGNDGDINISDDYFQGPLGTLSYVIDDDTVSLLEIADDATFFTGSQLKLALAGGYTPSEGQVFNLATVAGTLTDGNLLSIHPTSASSWTYAWVDDAGTTTLTATYVPEPASLSLLGLGAMGLLRRRRA